MNYIKALVQSKRSGSMWYVSKRVLLAIVTLFASYAQYKWGMVLDGPTQGMIIGVVMLVLTIISKGRVIWTEEEKEENKTEDV